MKIESATVNLPTVATIVGATFSLYFFIAQLIAGALLESKLYTIEELIKDDLEIVAMYRFQITNGIAKPDAAGRIIEIEAKIARREREADVLRAN